MVLHGDYRGGLGRYGNHEDVFLGFDLAEEVLVSDVLEAEGRFVFATCADFGRKQQRTRVQIEGNKIVMSVDFEKVSEMERTSLERQFPRKVRPVENH